MKSEPSVFSIDDLQRQGCTGWEGVRNYQARNFMRDGMRPGDQAFFYHSSCAEPGIAGIMEISRQAYPDPTQFDPRSAGHDPKSTRAQARWLQVDVRFIRRTKHLIALSTLREAKALAELALLRPGNRLSVMPMTKAQWTAVLRLESKAV